MQRFQAIPSTERGASTRGARDKDPEFFFFCRESTLRMEDNSLILQTPNPSQQLTDRMRTTLILPCPRSDDIIMVPQFGRDARMILGNGLLRPPGISSLTTVVSKTGFTDTVWMHLADRFIATPLDPSFSDYSG